MAERRPGLLGRVLAFLTVSGAGWLLDVALFTLLVHAVGLRPLLANVASTATAIVFVFSATHERVFDGPRERRRRHLVYYVLYQAALVATVSVVLALLLDATGLEPVVGKVLVTPFTVVCNYLVLGRIAGTGRTAGVGSIRTTSTTTPGDR